MLVSIIIPTYNAGDKLNNLLKSLEKQTYQNFEILIIDSSSTDNTEAIARRYTNKFLKIPKSDFDHGYVRSLAGKMSNGEILVYLTQDVEFASSCSLENLIEVFDENGLIAAAYGRQIPYESTNLFGKHLRIFNYPDSPLLKSKYDIKKLGIKTAFVSNSFAAYKRSALEQIGWFKSRIILGEDIYAGAKLILAGYLIAYVSNAIVYHSHNYSIRQEFKRYFDIGVFHRSENWIIHEFGKPEREGVNYIISELKYLIKQKSLHLLPEFFFRNVSKYVGYKLGYNFEKIPIQICKMFSMNQQWWEKISKYKD